MKLLYKSIDSVSTEEIRKFLNKNLEYDNFKRNSFEHILTNHLDFKNEDDRIAMTGKRIAGLILSAIDGSKGYIKMLCVDGKYRRKGIAALLLKTVEDAFKKKGVKEILVAYAPGSYFYSGVDPRYTEAYMLLKSSGYEREGETLELEVDLKNSLIFDTAKEKILLKDGYKFSRAKKDDFCELTELVEKNYGKIWKIELSNAMKIDPPDVEICRKENKIIGFSAFDTTRLECFGPIGVMEEFRSGKGIGRILLLRALRDMNKKGYSKGIIPINSGTLILFYGRMCGARIARIQWPMKKTLTQKCGGLSGITNNL